MTYVNSVVDAMGTPWKIDLMEAKRISYARIPTATNIALTETVDGATVLSVSHSAVTNTATYDAYRRETVRTDGRGNAMTNAYDALGRHIAHTDGRGNTRHTEYNAFGQRSASIDALGNRTTYSYDQFGNLASVTDPLGHATVYEYDLCGNITYEGGATYPVRYTYDIFGNKTTMTTYRREGRGNGEEGSVGDTTTWLYDEASGVLTNKVYADGKGPIYAYTPDVKLATRTWARGITTDYYYDGWGNLTNTVYSDGTPAITLFYDALGRQVEAYDAAGVTTFLYDAFGSLTNETVIGVAGTNTIIRHWDEFGRTAGYALNGTRQTTIGYELDKGRIATMGIPNIHSTTNLYNYFRWNYLDGSDLKSSLVYPNGLTASWTYDANNQLLQVCNATPANIISQYDYVYDVASRRITCAKSGSAFAQNDTLSYGYNEKSELTNAVAAVDANYRYAYEFDDIGNRESSSERGTNSVYAANNLNQYTSISNSAASALSAGEFVPQFDDDGNQTLIQTSTGIWQVQYNGENRPILWQCVSTNSFTPNSLTPSLISMSYDRIGRRVTKNNQRFVYDGYLCIGKIEDSTSIHYSLSPIHCFVWDPTELVATRPLAWTHGNSVAYYTHDGNKNVSEVMASDGAIAAHYEYAPFGALLSTSGSSATTNPLRFSSEYADDALGLVYYNYRHYEPNSSRWECRDPYGERAGLSLYCFLANRGDGVCDVMGLDAIPAGVPVDEFFTNPANKKKYPLYKYVSVNAYEIVYNNSMGDFFSFIPWQKVELREYYWRVEFTARFSPPLQLQVDKSYNSWGLMRWVVLEIRMNLIHMRVICLKMLGECRPSLNPN